METDDGTVIQDGLKHYERGPHPGDKTRHITWPVRGLVMAVYDIDDDLNKLNEMITCDIYVLSLSITLQKVPFLLGKASADNYISYKPIPYTENTDGSQFDAGRPDPKVANGDMVMVQFLDGEVHQPVITAMLPHPDSGFDGASPSPRTGFTEAEDFKIRFNGTNFYMDKDGNVKFENTATTDKTIPLEKTVTFEFKDKDNQVLKVMLDGPNKMITATNLNSANEGSQVVMEGTPGSEKISITSKSHFFVLDDTTGSESIYLIHKTGAQVVIDKHGTINIISFDGNYVLLDAQNHAASMVSKQGAVFALDSKVTITDASGKSAVTMDDTTVQVTGNNVTLSCQKCTLAGGTMYLGSNASHPAVLGDQLASLFDSHTHATVMGPSGPPLPPYTAALINANPATAFNSLYVFVRDNLT